MKVKDLIEKLNEIRTMKGDLLVSVFQRNNTFDDDGEYYINIELAVVNNTNIKLKNGQSEIIIVNEPCYLAIG